MDNNNQGGGDPNRGNRRRQRGYMLGIALLISWLAMSLISQIGNSGNEEISYNKFLNMVERGEVEKVKIGEDEIKIYPRNPPATMMPRSLRWSMRAKSIPRAWSTIRT